LKSAAFETFVPACCYTLVVARFPKEAARCRSDLALGDSHGQSQLRGNKEAKKPKKAKTPAGAPVSPFSANASASAAAAERNKKK